jgi:cobalamin-dependent methionine synthase I
LLDTKFAELASKLTKTEFQEYVKEVFYDTKRKFEIHVVSELMKEENEKVKSESTEKIEYVTSELEFKKKLPLYPDFFAFV